LPAGDAVEPITCGTVFSAAAAAAASSVGAGGVLPSNLLLRRLLLLLLLPPTAAWKGDCVNKWNAVKHQVPASCTIRVAAGARNLAAAAAAAGTVVSHMW
jgi:hypothetical protein